MIVTASSGLFLIIAIGFKLLTHSKRISTVITVITVFATQGTHIQSAGTPSCSLDTALTGGEGTVVRGVGTCPIASVQMCRGDRGAVRMTWVVQSEGGR